MLSNSNYPRLITKESKAESLQACQKLDYLVYKSITSEQPSANSPCAAMQLLGILLLQRGKNENKSKQKKSQGTVASGGKKLVLFACLSLPSFLPPSAYEKGKKSLCTLETR